MKPKRLMRQKFMKECLWACLMLLLPLMMWFLWCQPVCAGVSDSALMSFKQKALEEKQALEANLLDYISRKKDLEKDMPRLQSQYEWTGHMIERHKDRHQEIPEAARTHYDQVALHIEAGKREISRLELMVADQLARLETLNASVRDAFKPEDLKWWSCHPAVSAMLFNETGKSPAQMNTDGGSLFNRLHDRIQKSGIGDWVVLKQGKDGPVLNVDLPILFGSGKITVSRKYKSFLRKLANVIKPYEIEAKVEGFADHTPLKNKKYASNWELAARRALNVAQVLIDKGVKRTSCCIISHGENGKLSKAANRRVELTVYFKKSKNT